MSLNDESRNRKFSEEILKVMCAGTYTNCERICTCEKIMNTKHFY